MHRNSRDIEAERPATELAINPDLSYAKGQSALILWGERRKHFFFFKSSHLKIVVTFLEAHGHFL